MSKLTLNIGLAPSKRYNYQSPKWEEVTRALDSIFTKYKMRLAMSDTEPTLVVYGEYNPHTNYGLTSLSEVCCQEAIAANDTGGRLLGRHLR